MLKTEVLYYVVEVSRFGSINKAAEYLYISQPALSVAIKNLETTLGTKIFKRIHNGVVPTKEGVEIIAQCKKILNAIYELENYNCINQTIQFLYYPGMADYLMATYFTAFYTVFGNNNITFRDATMQEMLSALTASQDTFALAWYPTGTILQKQVLPDNVTYHQIFLSKVGIQISKNSNLIDAKTKAISVYELSEFPFLFLDSNNGLESYMTDILETIFSVQLKNVQKSASLTTHINNLEHCDCVDFIQENFYAKKINYPFDKFRYIPLKEDIYYSLNLYYNKDCSRIFLDKILNILFA